VTIRSLERSSKSHNTRKQNRLLTGLEKYLGSGLIKGVTCDCQTVAHFCLETLDIIETQIERLNEVPGIAKKRVKMIQVAWENQKVIKEVMVFLQGHGVSLPMRSRFSSSMVGGDRHGYE